MSATTGISNVQSVNVNDSILSTVSGNQILDASKLCCTSYLVPVWD